MQAPSFNFLKMDTDRERRRCPKNGWDDQSQKKTIPEADESQIKRIRKTTLRIGIFEFICLVSPRKLGKTI